MKDFDIAALPQYELQQHERLEDIHAEGYLLRHKKSGARIALIPCEDNNKVFNIAFRTTPTDSTGVAHIIEHTVLCGSKEFPLKDPFVELVKGSLNTFLNAMTYPDKTMYPVASTNDADFRNLMHVYLDAVFYPNIYRTENIFRQEGWHYELKRPEDELKYNGIVYNEMKGVYSSPDEMLEGVTTRALYPDTTYGVESGGDPDVIPTLTYEDYLNFHRRYYHPSNSYIYLYGNMDLADSLRFLDEHYLRHFDEIDPDSAVSYQKPFDAPITTEAFYPISDEEDEGGKTYLSYNMVCGNPMDMKESLALDVLDYALFSMPGAPVKQALVDAKIGTDVFGSYNDGILQPYFSVVAKGAEQTDTNRFLLILKEAMRQQAENGIDRDSLMAGINSMEFRFREADYSQFPKGLIYGIDLMDTWLYRDDEPFLALKQLAAYEALRNEIGSGYFEQLIEDKFLKNPHSALVVLSPKKGLLQEKEAAVQEQLAAYKASLSEDEVQQLVEETKALKAYQDEKPSEEALRCLPTLAISDIKREVTAFSNIEETVDADGMSIPVVRHETETNGIGYVDLYWNLKHIPEEYLPYAALLREIFFNIDTKSHPYAELNNRMNIETGGIQDGISSMDDPDDNKSYQAFFTISAKAVYERLSVAFDLIREVLTESKLDDEKRLYEILAEKELSMQMMLVQAGNAAAALRANSYISSVGAMGDMIGGIGYYRFIKSLKANFAEQKTELIAKLKKVQNMLFRPEYLTVSYTAAAEGREALLRDVLKVVVPTTPDADILKEELLIQPIGCLNEGFMTSGQVQFVAQAGSFDGANIRYNGAMQIYRQLMSYEYLWDRVRVNNGAYGCGASMTRNGMGTFVSYRDPKLGETLDIYQGTPEFLRDFKADAAEMTKFIIGTMSGVDVPLTPYMFGSLSMKAYLTKRTEEMRQKTRDEILNATAEDIRALAPAAEALLASNAICVIGSEAAIRAEEDRFGRIEMLL